MKKKFSLNPKVINRRAEPKFAHSTPSPHPAAISETMKSNAKSRNSYDPALSPTTDDPAVEPMESSSTPSDEGGDFGLISSWIEIKSETISSPNDPVQLSRTLTLGEWDCERQPCFCLTFKVRPKQAPKWFYQSINLNKKEAEWFKQNSNQIIFSRRPQRHDIKNRDGLVTRTVTTETQTLKGVDKLVIIQTKNGKEHYPFRLSIRKAGDLIRGISDSLDEFQNYLDKHYDSEGTDNEE